MLIILYFIPGINRFSKTFWGRANGGIMDGYAILGDVILHAYIDFDNYQGKQTQ